MSGHFAPGSGMTKKKEMDSWIPPTLRLRNGQASPGVTLGRIIDNCYKVIFKTIFWITFMVAKEFLCSQSQIT